LGALSADFLCRQGSLPKWKGVTRRLRFLVCSRQGRRG
jgi:hypothetical protein